VRSLCGRATAYDASFGDQADEWGILDSYYVPTRYPNGLPDDIPARVYNHAAAKSALALAEAVVSYVQRRLPARTGE
jgi:HEPN domain-containing protein